MTAGPLISVLTPAYNAAAFLDELCESVRQQTFLSHEHLIVDDGSTDAGLTARVLADQPGVSWYSRENRGQYPSQNELISRARGTYVNVICADDRFASVDVFDNVARLAATAQPEVIFGDTEVLVGESGLTYCPYLRGSLGWKATHRLLMIQHCSVFVRRDFLLANDLLFSTRYRIRGDWEWLIRVRRAAKTIAYLGGTAAHWRWHAEQTSRNQAAGERETREMLVDAGLSFHAHAAARQMWAPYGRISKALAVQRRDGLVALGSAGAAWLVRQASGAKAAK